MDTKYVVKELNKITVAGVILFLGILLMVGAVCYQQLIPYEIAEEHNQETTNVAISKASLPHNVQVGKELFLMKCASCHNNDMVSDMTGPALKGVTERWKKYGNEALYRWIQNNQALIDEQHPKALAVSNWTETDMTTFEELDSTDINAILAYIEL